MGPALTRAALEALVERIKSERPTLPVTNQELSALTLAVPLGSHHSPDEILQAVVDGTQIPIKVILQADPDLSGNPAFAKFDWAGARADANLGVLYDHAESLWDDCLWNGYRIERTEEGLGFKPRDMIWPALEAASEMRRLNLGQEFAMRAMHQIETEFDLDDPKVRRSLAPFSVKAVVKVNGRQEIQLGEACTESSIARVLVARLYASEPYYKELLTELHLALKGASVDHLLTTWAVVSSASAVLLNKIDDDERAEAEDFTAWLPKHAPTLQVEALVRACTKAAGVSREQAIALIEFLTYRGADKQELWTQPLVPVGTGTVCPFFSTTESPNLGRVIDVWLNQLQVDLGRRGPAFEAHIRGSLVEYIANSPLLKGTAMCLDTHLKFTPPGEREEEIDVVAVVGDVLLMGEAKCLLLPTEAKEFGRHREKVEDAARQIKRKAEAVERNRDAFRVRAAEVGLVLPPVFRVQPIVLLNRATHVGIPIEGVPVVDEFIMGVFFSGELTERALKVPGEAPVATKKKLLYTTTDEAAGVLPSFLAQPPQMVPLFRGVKRRLVPVPAVNERDWHGTLLTLTCVPSADFDETEDVEGAHG